MTNKRIETGKGICPGCGYYVLRGGKYLPVTGYWHKKCLKNENKKA